MNIKQWESRELEGQICLDLFKDNKRIPHAQSEIKPEFFSDGSFKAVYESILEAYSGSKVVEFITVKQILKNRGLFESLFGGTQQYLDWVTSTDYQTANYASHIKELKFAYKVRKMQYFGVNMMSWYQEDSIDARDKFQQFMDEMKGLTTSIDEVRDVSFHDAYELAIEESQREPKFFKTPHRRLNKALGGGISDFTILAARTGVGKTTIATSLLAHGMQEGAVIPFFNTEMSESALALRVFSSVFKESLYDQRYDTEKLRRAKELDWYADSRSRMISKYRLSVSDIKFKLEEMCEEYVPDLVIIDYLQKIHPDTRKQLSLFERVTSVINDLKDIQKQLDIPFLVLAQIKRLGGKEASIEDLKGSGDIEQDADNIIIAKSTGMSYEDYPIIQLDIHKSRHSGISVGAPLQYKHIGDQYRYEEVPESESLQVNTIYD